jgi:hypothetical protein
MSAAVATTAQASPSAAVMSRPAACAWARWTTARAEAHAEACGERERERERESGRGGEEDVGGSGANERGVETRRDERKPRRGGLAVRGPAFKRRNKTT